MTKPIEHAQEYMRLCAAELARLRAEKQAELFKGVRVHVRLGASFQAPAKMTRRELDQAIMDSVIRRDYAGLDKNGKPVLFD